MAASSFLWRGIIKQAVCNPFSDAPWAWPVVGLSLLLAAAILTALALRAIHSIAALLYGIAERAQSPKWMRRFATLFPMKTRALLVWVDTSILLVEERWNEALQRMEDLPPTLPVRTKLQWDNTRAWCMLQSGDVPGGLALTEAVCASRVRIDRDSREDFEGTRAIALLLSGRAAEALPELERLVAVKAPARSRAIRWYYLGEARRALGRADAADAYQRAIDVAPGRPWAKRAEARLADGAAYR